MMFSGVAANRTAQEAVDASGLYAFSSFSAGSGIVASAPPLTGSMTTTGLPWRAATS